MTSADRTPSTLRPTEELKPTDARLQQAYDLVNGGDGSGALQAIEGYTATAEYDQHWANYIRGLALFATQKLDDGIKEFMTPYSVMSLSPKTPRSSEQFRLIGKCLKKIGWYYRNKNEFEKSYAFHSIEYTLFEQYGSYADLHDAAVSLDNDAFNMKNPLLDEHWIRVSIEVGEQIPDEQTRYAAIGMSYNNLAATLSDLGRFEEAEKPAKESLANWESYENLAGTKENRTVWAYFGLADLYLNWAKAVTSADSVKYQTLKKSASTAIREAIAIGERQTISDDDMKTLTQEQQSIVELPYD